MSLHRFAEAKVTLCEAKKKIRGMPFETALVLCESQMLAANGDADGALHVLTALGGCSQEANTSIVVGSRLGDATIDSKTGQIQRAKAAIHLHGRRTRWPTLNASMSSLSEPNVRWRQHVALSMTTKAPKASES